MKTRFLALYSLLLFPALQALAQQAPAPAPVPPSPGYYMPYWHGPGHMWGGGFGFGWGGPLLWLVLIVLFLLVFLLGRRSACGWHHHHPGPWQMRGGSPGPGGYGDPTFTALQILNERYARGEIPKQEYEEKKAAILAPGTR